MLPHVGIGELTGFIERLYGLGGREDLYDLARDLQLEADDCCLWPRLPIFSASGHPGRRYLLTPEGIEFAEAGVQEEKTLFRRQALPHIVLLGQILRELKSAPDHRLQEDHLLEQLEACFSPARGAEQLDTVIDWGRYSELFGYDDEAGEFFLEDEPQL